MKSIDWQLTVERLHGDEKAAREIITLFLKELPEAQVIINQAFEKDQFDKLYDALHRLHGGCCYVGVPALQKITRQFCDAVKQRKKDNYAELLNAFNAQSDAVMKDAEHI